MKIQVTMKDPDTLQDAISDAVTEQLKAECPDFDDEEREGVAEMRAEKIRKLAGKWFRYGEYLSVEIDTETDTCTVLPA